jgi:hypothetical protein
MFLYGGYVYVIHGVGIISCLDEILGRTIATLICS